MRGEVGTRFASLRHRNFRLFWTGQAISVVGTWMQSVALYWLVYRLTRSAFLLGLTGVALTLPILCLSLLGGVVADRVDRRKLVTLTQALSLAQAVALAAWVQFGHPQAVHLIVLAFAGGVVNAFDLPARQSFLSELVEPRDLPNAIALNSMIFNSARLVGPAIAGLILARSGEAACFWVNAASYVPLLWNLRRVRIPPRRGNARVHALTTLIEGVRYALRAPRIRHLLLLMGFTGTLGFQYAVLMPIYAGNILNAGARGYGLLVAAAGIGAVFAALALTARMERPALRRLLLIGLSFFGLGLVAFSFSRTLWLSAALNGVVGFGMILYAATSNTLLQTTVLDEFRGRVMSFFTLMLLGTAPLGSFVSGTVAQKMGAPAATRISGVACLVGALWLWRRLRVVARDEAARAPGPVAGGGIAATLPAPDASSTALATGTDVEAPDAATAESTPKIPSEREPSVNIPS